MSKKSLEAIIEGERAAKRGILHLLTLGTVKLAAGMITGIQVIIADGISTFADILGVFGSYLGLKISRKSADAQFEYGYYKVETLIALLISIGICYMGYSIITGAVLNFNRPTEGENHIIAALVTVIAIIQSYYLGVKLKKAGVKSNSLALIASADDKKMDVVAGFAVLVSVIANYKSIPYVESIVSVIIGIFILKVGILSAKDSLFFLLDYWNDPVLTKKIKKVLLSENDLVTGVKKIRLRRAGTYIFGEAFVDINPFVDIQDLRASLSILEDKIQNLSPYLKDFPIYSHIPNTNRLKIAIPIKRGKGMKAEIADSMSKTNSYLFLNIFKGKVSKFYVKKLKKSNKILQLADFLKKEKVNILLNNKLNSLVYYNLRRTNQILIYPILDGAKRAEDMVKLILIDS